MVRDIAQSIQLILNDRITSPFAGSFFFSWFVWNWKLLYYLFLSNIGIPERFDYIDKHFINLQHNIVYPFLSAVFLIVVYPLVTTGALRVWLIYRKWQTDLKNRIEGQQLITLEQSIRLRYEFQNQQKVFDEIVTSKVQELKSKDIELTTLREKLSRLETPSPFEQPDDESDSQTRLFQINEEFGEILREKKVMSSLPTLIASIQNDSRPLNVPFDVLALLEGYGIVTKRSNTPYLYDFTEKGRTFLKAYSKMRLDPSNTQTGKG